MRIIKFLLTAVLISMISCCSTPLPEDELSPENPSTKDDNTLIVYFSWSGNTQSVANTIQNLTGYDIVEIEVLEPYSSIYNEVTARARQELDNDIRPELVTRIENINEYNMFIVGTPIWGSHLAPPVKSFLTMYDLTGKKIAPFCTHGGSGTANSVNDIRSVCPNSEILQPLAIYGSHAENSQESIERWLTTIGLIK